MPAAWRVRVIEESLLRSGIGASVRERDIYTLEGDERHAVVDAMIASGAEPPMVLVAGKVACHGEIDLDAVASAAREVVRGRD